MVMQGAGVWTVTLFSNFGVRTFRRPNRFAHVTDLLFDFTRIRRHFSRYVNESEEIFGVDFTMTNKLVVDVTEETPRILIPASVNTHV